MGELLTSLPLTDASTLKQKKNIEEPKGWLKKLQGLFTVERDNLLKTCDGPFKVDSTIVGAKNFTVIGVGKKGVRYFIHTVSMTVVVSAATATTYTIVQALINGSSEYLAAVASTASVVQQITNFAQPDCLIDEETPVTIGTDAAAAEVIVSVSYCEVPV